MLRPSICLLVAFPVAALAAPAEPTGKWVMDYSPTACTAKRAFGDSAIAITPAPLGATTRILVELPGRAMRAKHVTSAVDPGDGRGVIPTTSIVFPTKRTGYRAIYTVMKKEDAERVMTSSKFAIRTGKGAEREIVVDRAADTTGVDLDLGKMAALNQALGKCMADLRKHWDIVDGTIPPPPKRTVARGDLRTLFTSDDYPEDALSRNLKGKVNYTLMVDDKGLVADCVVNQSSGIAVLDAMGCQVLRERARFTPATDMNGKPVGDIVVTPTFVWMLQR